MRPGKIRSHLVKSHLASYKKLAGLDFEVIRWICHQVTYIDEPTLKESLPSIYLYFRMYLIANLDSAVHNCTLSKRQLYGEMQEIQLIS